MGMNPKVNLVNIFASSLQGSIPSALRDCSTYQFRYTSPSEMEFHQ